MSTEMLSCTFLGDQYSIPADILQYLDLLSEAETAEQKIADFVVREIRRTNSPDYKVLPLDMDRMLPILKEQASIFIQKLCDNNIFSATIDDFVTDNPGYTYIDETNKAGVKAFSQYLLDEVNSWEAGFNAAQQRAASSITGSGARIYTSDMFTFAATAAMEYSVISKQAKKADAMYRAELDRVSRAGASVREKKELQYMQSTYLPSMMSAISVYVYSMLDKYIELLTEKGLFNSDALQYVDIKRSQSLLGNLKLSSNVNAVLASAFTACPFNKNVYLEAQDRGLLDESSTETAKLFRQEKYVTARQEKEQLMTILRGLKDEESTLQANRKKIQGSRSPIEKKITWIKQEIINNNQAIQKSEKKIFGKKKAQEELITLRNRSSELSDELEQVEKQLAELDQPLKDAESAMRENKEAIARIEGQITELDSLLDNVTTADTTPTIHGGNTYKVTLRDVSADKLSAIRILREVKGLGLAEAKNMVESLPQVIVSNISQAEAEGIGALFTKIGCSVTVWSD